MFIDIAAGDKRKSGESFSSGRVSVRVGGLINVFLISMRIEFKFFAGNAEGVKRTSSYPNADEINSTDARKKLAGRLPASQ